MNQNFSTFPETHGIVHHMTMPHTKQQNGVAERKNRVINDAIHAQLAEASLLKCLWADCATHTVFTLNVISLTASNISTYKLWSGKELPVRVWHGHSRDWQSLTEAKWNYYSLSSCNDSGGIQKGKEQWCVAPHSEQRL
jgi:transposase InsO family protein